MILLIFAMVLGLVAGVGLDGCGLSSKTGNADSGVSDSGGSDSSSPDAGTDSALPTTCEALETAVVSQIATLSACSGNDVCEAIYSPFCGAQTSRFDTGCFLYRTVNASLDALNANAASCRTQSCVDGCMPADCDCAELPAAACVGGRCTRAVSENDLAICEGGDTCIVVPYSHCCGSTKRAIRASLLDAYNSHPEWQVFNVPSVCAVIGACLDDSAVTEATCADGQCALVYP